MTAMNTLATIALLFALAVTTLFGAGYAVARFIPPLRIAIRILGYLFLTLLIPFVFFIAYELSFYPPFTRSPQIFGQGESIHGKFMVVGSCEGFSDWQISLLWKPPGKPWAEYYLDCDGDYWTDFEMIDSGDHLLLKYPAEYDGATADIDLKTGLESRPLGSPPQIPLRLVLGGNPILPNASSIDENDKNWAKTWAEFQRNLASGK